MSLKNRTKQVHLDNARLLYVEDDFLKGHWQKSDEKLFHFIESAPKLQLKIDRTHLYFFADSTEIWVAREVIGHLSALPEEFSFFDVNKGEALEIPLDKLWFDLDLGEVHQIGLDQWRELSKITPNLAPTWRLVFDWYEDMPKIAFNYFFLI